MKLRDLYILSVVMVVCCILLVGCSNSECYDNRNSLPLAGFYSAETKKAAAVDSLSVWAIDVPGDTLLLNNARNISQTWMPFNLDATQTSFVFRYMQKRLDNPRLNDTITFNYEIQPWFESPACGAIYRYHVKGMHYTTHLIDSVAITAPDSVITNKPGQNIQIYFR